MNHVVMMAGSQIIHNSDMNNSGSLIVLCVYGIGLLFFVVIGVWYGIEQYKESRPSKPCNNMIVTPTYEIEKEAYIYCYTPKDNDRFYYL